jgi:1-acyl-sn-glycerol-3-phosphate acyltransferase
MHVAPPDGASRPGALRRFASYALFYVGLFGFGIGCLIWSIPASLLFRIMPRKRGARLGQYAIMVGFRTFIGAMELLGIFRCDLTALDALRAEDGLVIAPNHPALLDAVLVISRLPRVVCITKASLWDNLFLGGGVRLAGYIRNDVPLKLVRRGMEELTAGHQLLVFPEGTRTVEPPVNAFKGGFLLMARKARVPVQTVFIDGNSGYLGKGWPLFRKPDLPLVYRARLGRRFDVPADVQAFTADLEAYFRSELGGTPPAPRQAA